MDVFIEKVISRKKTRFDYILMGALISIWLYIAIFTFSLRIFVDLFFIVDVLLLVGLVFVIRGRNVEFEYAITNGDLDIDKIIAKRKRKRLFSANCRDFDIVARVTHESFNEAKKIQKKIIAISSKDSPDIYFLTVNYKEEKTLVIFEPDERMMKAFKIYIPKKVFD